MQLTVLKEISRSCLTFLTSMMTSSTGQFL